MATNTSKAAPERPEKRLQDTENQSLISDDSDPSTSSESKSSWRSSLFLNERGLRAGWRFVLFLILLRLVLIPMVFVAAKPFRHLLESRVGDISDALLFLCILLGTLIMSKVERRSMLSYGLRDSVALSRLFAGSLIGFASLSLMLLGLRATHHLVFGPRYLGGSQLLMAALLNLLGFLIVALFEENAFRGYALHTLTEGIGFWPAAIVMALLFAALHVQNPGESEVGIAAVFAFGMMLAFSLWRTGTLLWAIGFHFMWDYSESFLYGVPDSGLVQPEHLLSTHLSGPAWITGGSVGPEGSWFIFVLLGVVALIIHFLYPHNKFPQAIG
ncbi:MAG: CPBP family intramembrane metalloprotease domain-containing protein [Acidobacteria bacterium]|nr:MAG: CPBP family intramembrane metalloprotease domain-containing protein [Acidobacteriota bacterium]PYX99223.1 MAG: CPBP family intramembrane metalloprotease domain-containing protein [Acidobacteriota bacterium]PYY22967.1 MAG: CPBP family intramembrane metalloprotease domain-containing protein [Acidobacteriota bacterium]